MLSDRELDGKLAELRRLRDESDEHTKAKSLLHKQIESVNAQLVEYFEANDLTQIRKESLGTFYITTSANPKVEDPEALEEWLRDKGDLDLMMSFNTSKFKTYYKELLDQNEELPPNVEVFLKTDVRLRRS